MTPKTYSCFILVLVAALGGITRGESLEAAFKNPQNSARPHTWFHWMNGHVTKSGITKDLEAMQAAGIGGYQLFDIGWGTPKGLYPYASEGWLDRVGHCAEESTRTGVQMGFHNCSGWSSSGGPWVSAEKSMKWVVWREAQVTRDSETVLLEEPHPIKGVHDAKLNIYDAHKDKRFYEDIVVLAFPTPTDPFRIENWERKALSNGGDSRTQHFAPDKRTATP
ncbi:MAG: hypothetical protein MI702_07650, partial [Chlorobiales bacterium]|nr:hypothetical protein [Chlorobiales bacterium]